MLGRLEYYKVNPDQHSEIDVKTVCQDENTIIC